MTTLNNDLAVASPPRVRDADAGRADGSPRVSPVLQSPPPRDRPAAQRSSATLDADLLTRARAALDAGVNHLLSKQHADGHFCAELEGDSILQSEYILAIFIIGQERDPWFAARLPKIANYLRKQQRDDGSWGQYPGGKLGGGKFDLSATVKGYFALKLMGDDPDAPHMARARKLILEHGGAERVNSFSKFYLACLGQVSYNAVPTIPPQVVFLPHWFYFHLDKVSAWSRTMIVPLSIVTTTKVRRELPEELHIGELFADPRNRDKLLATGFGKSPFWTRFFLGVDRAMKIADRFGLMKIGRDAALRRMEDWLVEHCEGSDGPGAIFPPIVYLLIALIGGREYGVDERVIRDNHRHLSNYMIYGEPGSPRNGEPYPLGDDEDAPDLTHGPRAEKPVQPEDVETIRLQPCESPLWDTGIAAFALTDAGFSLNDDAMRRCADWLLSKECRKKADWVANVRDEVDFSGWFFEYHNPWYPDVDDTVMVSMALKRLAGDDASEADAGATGGSSASASVSSRESNVQLADVARAHDVQPDVNETSQRTGTGGRAASGARAGTNPECQIRNPKSSALAASQRSLAWILAMQNDDGGWAAFDRTRDRPLYDCVPFADHNAIQDPSCADITGRTLECLGHHGLTTSHPAVRRAINYLRDTQEREGCWFGRWGVNYVYGTWQATCGLRQVGQDMTEPWVQQAGRWLKSVQKEDGSFGESADSYEDASLKGRGPSTATQTAWGVMALMAVCGPRDEAVQRGIRWLCDTQELVSPAGDLLNPPPLRAGSGEGDFAPSSSVAAGARTNTPRQSPPPDLPLEGEGPENPPPRSEGHVPPGTWREEWFTGTGFPKVFYLRYHLYRLYFPVMCLGRWLREAR